MKTLKAEWFKFYHRDFFGDENVMRMDNRQIGIYLRLLSHQWDHGSLPLDIPLLAKIAGEDIKEFETIWWDDPLQACFENDTNVTDQRLFNPRLRLEWEQMRAEFEAKSIAGKKGVQAKALKNKDILTDPKQSLSTPSTTLKPKELEIEKEIELLEPKHIGQKKDSAPLLRNRFETVWKDYPRKLKKEKAFLKFKKQVGTEKDFEDIQTALVNYKADVVQTQKTQPDLQYQHGSTWFNNNWRDYINLKPITNGSSPMSQAILGRGPFVDAITGLMEGGADPQQVIKEAEDKKATIEVLYGFNYIQTREVAND